MRENAYYIKEHFSSKPVMKRTCVTEHSIVQNCDSAVRWLVSTILSTTRETPGAGHNQSITHDRFQPHKIRTVLPFRGIAILKLGQLYIYCVTL